MQLRLMSQPRWYLFVILFTLCLLPLRLSLAQPLVELARPGPWAGVSGLLAYRGKLYLVNSQIFINHNAADIYSYDLSTQTNHQPLRFEHRLFSQDAGTPAVIDGLMYWPFEDPRFSTTHGEYIISDGHTWQWRAAPEIRGFHVHAIHQHQGDLYALGSGWRGRIYHSTDRGQTWPQLYEHPTPDGKVSWVTAMISHRSTLYFAATTWADADTVKLLYLQGDRVRPVPGWPSGHSIGAMGAFGDQLYAVNRIDDTARLWRYRAGQPAQPVAALDGYRVQAFAATSTTLWAVSTGPQGGLLWRTTDGHTWQQAQSFPDLPVSLTVADGQVFVGIYNEQRGGALWGPASPQSLRVPQPVMLPARPGRQLSSAALQQAVLALDDALFNVNPKTYRQRLLSALLPLALSHDPAAGAVLSERLKGPLPKASIERMVSKTLIPAARVARWYLLFAVALNGHGHIPPNLLTAPWSVSPNGAEKYYEPMPAAAWAVAELGQNDLATRAALQRALRSDTPAWVKGDILLALHRLYDVPFRYPAP
ncbi:hypothetical protein C2W62_21265 [Candidatus Entotheonella serta]|nr:hypothetical protein C2W62_21265 [Candidatus Entotheonella serta]